MIIEINDSSLLFQVVDVRHPRRTPNAALKDIHVLIGYLGGDGISIPFEEWDEFVNKVNQVDCIINEKKDYYLPLIKEKEDRHIAYNESVRARKVFEQEHDEDYEESSDDDE